MVLLPYSRKRVSEQLSVRVSNHFFYSDFGVRDNDEYHRYGHRYVCSGTPGTGFIERESESHSYHEFVRGHMSVQPPQYRNLLLGREPSFGRELRAAHDALLAATDARKREMLECYANALAVAQNEEMLQRIVQAIKKKMGHHANKYMVSLIGRYRHRMTQLERDMRGVEYRLKEHVPAEVYDAWCDVCDAFDAMIRRCRRVWHHNGQSRNSFSQVFFDMGVFDYIRSDRFLPLMRDSVGVSYYLLPDCILVARTSTDFDLVPLKSTTLVWQEMAMQEPTEILVSQLVDAACMIQLPTLGTSFYFNHARVVIDFVRAVDKLKTLL